MSRLGSEISKVVYPTLGILDRPITSYSKESVGDAVINAYRWSLREGYKFSNTLVNDILRSICAEKCRYTNCAVNKRKRDAGIPVPVGRPKKQQKRQATRKRSETQASHAPYWAYPQSH